LLDLSDLKKTMPLDNVEDLVNNAKNFADNKKFQECVVNVNTISNAKVCAT
jgi:hypothetical protein